jgi:hypothetical protein
MHEIPVRLGVGVGFHRRVTGNQLRNLGAQVGGSFEIQFRWTIGDQILERIGKNHVFSKRCRFSLFVHDFRIAVEAVIAAAGDSLGLIDAFRVCLGNPMGRSTPAAVGIDDLRCGKERALVPGAKSASARV